MFGEITYIQRHNARSIRVTIRAEKLTVSYPTGMPQSEADKFLQDNAASIKAKQDKLKTILDNKSEALEIRPEKTLQTLTFKVVANATQTERLHFRLENNVLRVDYPETLSIADAQPYFWKGITYFLRKEAKRILPARTEELASIYGFKYSSVKIQSSKTRWGSCSTSQNINLSLYLLLAPQHVIDYVILHELCHTVEMNHGERFWALMDKVTAGSAKKLRAELKQIKVP